MISGAASYTDDSTGDEYVFTFGGLIADGQPASDGIDRWEWMDGALNNYVNSPRQSCDIALIYFNVL